MFSERMNDISFEDINIKLKLSNASRKLPTNHLFGISRMAEENHSGNEALLKMEF